MPTKLLGASEMVGLRWPVRALREAEIVCVHVCVCVSVCVYVCVCVVWGMGPNHG